MRQRPRASALKVPKPHFGKSGLREYLYYLLNQGEILKSPNSAPRQAVAQESPCLEVYEVGLFSATQAEADRLNERISGAMGKHLDSPARHRFTSYGLDQAWRPQHLFDEIHWLHGLSTCPPPQEFLQSLGSNVHIHLYENSETKLQPGFHTYHWRSEKDLTEFWASLYLSREIGWPLDLDWEGYCMWQPRISCIATVISGWGSTPRDALDALLASVDATNPTDSEVEILIIEGGMDTCLGDYVDIVRALERNLELECITTIWVSPNYSGFGLKLLTFRYPQQQRHHPRQRPR